MILEICVDDVAGLEAAVRGGADRIELCAALSGGGVTPSAGFMHRAAAYALPVSVMIRPRAGDFVFTRDEADVMKRDIDAARAAGFPAWCSVPRLAMARSIFPCSKSCAATPTGSI